MLDTATTDRAAGVLLTQQCGLRYCATSDEPTVSVRSRRV